MISINLHDKLTWSRDILQFNIAFPSYFSFNPEFSWPDNAFLAFLPTGNIYPDVLPLLVIK